MATWKSIFPIPHDAGKPDLDAVLDAAVLDSHEILDIQARLRGYVAVTNTDIVPVEYGVNGSGAGWFRRAWDDGGTFVNLAAEWAKQQGLILEPPPTGGVDAVALSAMEFQEPKWAIPNILPEGLALLAGAPKCGKSWLALDYGIAIAGGYNAMGNVECEPGPVLYLSLEGGQRLLANRLKAVLQERPPPKNLHFFTEWKNMDDGGLDDIERWLAHFPAARAVIIDMLSNFRGGRDRGEDIYQGDYRVLSPIKKLAEKYNVTILLLHHENKIGQISGTTAMTGAPDTILTLKRQSSDIHGVLAVKGREVEEQDLALEFDKQTGRWTKIGNQADFRQSEERKAVIRLLADSDPMTPAELGHALGKKHGASSARTLLHKMHKAGQIAKLPDGKFTVFGA